MLARATFRNHALALCTQFSSALVVSCRDQPLVRAIPVARR